MRGAVVGGSGAVNGGYFCRGLPTDFDGWGLPGWAWADVLPHFRAIETDLDFDGLAARRLRDRSSSAVFPNSTAAQHRSCVPPAKPGSAGSPTSTVPHVTSHCRRHRRGATEHRRRYQGGPGWRVPAARAGPPESHPADQHPGQAGACSTGGAAVGVDVRGTRRADRSGRRPNRVVRRRDRFGTSADAVRRRTARRIAGRGSPGGGRPAGRCGVCGPSGMGAAGGLDGDPRPAAARGGAHTPTVSRSGPTQAASAPWSRATGRSGRPIHTSAWR